MPTQPGVPIGTVLDWWKAPRSRVPDGFQLADGSPVTDRDSPFFGSNLPDLRGRYIKGAQTPRQLGTAGGATSHNHGDHEHVWAQTTPQCDWMTDDLQHSGVLLTGWTGKGVSVSPQANAMSPLATNLGSAKFCTESSGVGDAAHEPPYFCLFNIIRIK